MKKIVSSPTPDDLLARIAQEYKFVVPPPTHLRLPSVGDTIQIGNLKNVVLRAWSADKRFLVADHDEAQRRTTAHAWTHLRTPKDAACIGQPDDISISSYNRDVDGLMNTMQHAGIELETPYQRPLEWTLEDKQKLIETIFENGNIGSICLNRRDYGSPTKLYEAIDGKQRLNALWEFYTSQFPVHGRYFAELSHRDSYQFLRHNIPVVILQEADELTILRVFYRLNRHGRRLSEQHLNHIREQILACGAQP